MAAEKTVITCEVLRLEMEKLIDGRDIGLEVVEAALHRTPQKMPGRLNEIVQKAEEGGATEIIMGYGLCSHGLNGLRCGGRSLRIARCHDCLGLLLGSPKRHLKVLAQWPGAFYMFAGLVAASFDPLSCLERDHIPRLGEKKAFRAMELSFKNYTHFAYIENRVDDDPKYRKRFLENCRAFGKEPLELDSDLDYFRRLLFGRGQPSEDIIMLTGGQQLTSDDFL